jgi:hypothetical protein
MPIPKQSTEFHTEVSEILSFQLENNKAQITEIKPSDKPDCYSVLTKSESINAVIFPDIEKETLVEALRKQRKLDLYAETLFGCDIQEYFNHGYEVECFYKSMVQLVFI